MLFLEFIELQLGLTYLEIKNTDKYKLEKK